MKQSHLSYILGMLDKEAARGDFATKKMATGSSSSGGLSFSDKPVYDPKRLANYVYKNMPVEKAFPFVSEELKAAVKQSKLLAILRQLRGVK